MRARRLLGVSTLLLLLGTAAAGAAEQVLTLDPVASQVTFTLDATMHAAHGAIAITSGEIRFDLDAGTASGAVVLDATSADTGGEKRDRKMHEEVLESRRFPEIVFRPSALSAAVDERGTGVVTLDGTVSIHGADHPLRVRATVARSGETVTATATIAVPYVAWGMRDPSVFVLRVAKEVEVAFSVTGTLGDAGGPVAEQP